MLIFKFIITAILFLGCEGQGKSAKAKNQGGPPGQVGVGPAGKAGKAGHPLGGPPGQMKKLQGNPGIPIGPITPGSGSGFPEIHAGGDLMGPDSGFPMDQGVGVPLGPGGDVPMVPGGGFPLDPNGGVPLNPEGVPLGPVGIPLGEGSLQSVDITNLLNGGSNNHPGGILTINGDVLPSIEQPKTLPGTG